MQSKNNYKYLFILVNSSANLLASDKLRLVFSWVIKLNARSSVYS